MNNPDRIRIWTNFFDTIKMSSRLFFEHLNLKWWFKFGDYIMDRVNGYNNAGDFKFRKNMIIIWFLLWSIVITILPSYYELFPLVAVLLGAFVWTRD